MLKHYVIGDVHGEYETLLALVAKLPSDAKVVFVGDLVDKGLQSKEVISFIRENGYASVKGNHESSVIEAGKRIISYLNHKGSYEAIMEKWTHNRLGTFLSYGLVKQMEDGYLKFIDDKKAIEAFLYDATWMENLPLYLELDVKHSSGKKVVVSHSNISKIWDIRHDKSQQDFFKYSVQWTRDHKTVEGTDIFNIYGHTPQKYGLTIEKEYVCVDTGCCYHERKEYGRLTAYCVETGEFFEVSRKSA
jgi:serine/threonine protein phosphatase 1